MPSRRTIDRARGTRRRVPRCARRSASNRAPFERLMPDPHASDPSHPRRLGGVVSRCGLHEPPDVNPTCSVDFTFGARVGCVCRQLSPSREETSMVVSQEEHLEEVSKGHRFDWKGPTHPSSSPSAASTSRSSRRSRRSRTSRSGCEDPSKALRNFDMRPMPWWGADLSDIDFQKIYYFIRSTEKQAATGTSCPRTSEEPGTSWASPRPSRSTWEGSAPSTSPRSSITRSSPSWTSWA